MMSGMERVNSRMAEIQAKIASLSPKPETSFADTFATTMGDQPMNPLSGSIEPIPSQLQSLAEQAAARNGVDPNLFKALVNQESGWKPDAVSKAGAMGLCQLMPDTARGLGVSDPFNASESLEGGAKYLRQMLDQFGNDPSRALAAYNAGPGRIKTSTPADWPAETKDYVSRIMSHWQGR